MNKFFLYFLESQGSKTEIGDRAGNRRSGRARARLSQPDRAKHQRAHPGPG